MPYGPDTRPWRRSLDQNIPTSQSTYKPPEAPTTSLLELSDDTTEQPSPTYEDLLSSFRDQQDTINSLKHQVQNLTFQKQHLHEVNQKLSNQKDTLLEDITRLLNRISDNVSELRGTIIDSLQSDVEVLRGRVKFLEDDEPHDSAILNDWELSNEGRHFFDSADSRPGRRSMAIWPRTTLNEGDIDQSTSHQQLFVGQGQQTSTEPREDFPNYGEEAEEKEKDDDDEDVILYRGV